MPKTALNYIKNYQRIDRNLDDSMKETGIQPNEKITLTERTVVEHLNKIIVASKITTKHREVQHNYKKDQEYTYKM